MNSLAALVGMSPLEMQAVALGVCSHCHKKSLEEEHRDSVMIVYVCPTCRVHYCIEAPTE